MLIQHSQALVSPYDSEMLALNVFTSVGSPATPEFSVLSVRREVQDSVDTASIQGHNNTSIARKAQVKLSAPLLIPRSTNSRCPCRLEHRSGLSLKLSRSFVCQPVRFRSIDAIKSASLNPTSYGRVGPESPWETRDILSEPMLTAPDHDSTGQGRQPSPSSRNLHGSLSGPTSSRSPNSNDTIDMARPTSATDAPEECGADVEGPETSVQRSERTYRLAVLQEPSLGCAFEDNLLSRIGLAAPLVVELQVLDADGRDVDASDDLPFLICQCSLLEENNSPADMVVYPKAPSVTEQSSTLTSASSASGPSSRRAGDRTVTNAGSNLKPSACAKSASSTESGRKNLDERNASGDASGTFLTTPGPSIGRHVRMLYGTLIAGPQHLQSPQGSQKAYFLFPEISIRAPGRFRLQCQLMRLHFPNPSGQSTSRNDQVLASTVTSVVPVVARQAYVAPYITDLSRHFARQGVPLLLPPGVSAD